jgi:hypothetical protein
MLSLPLIIASILQVMESNSIAGVILLLDKAINTSFNKRFNRLSVGCYLLFSRLELKLPMIIFHTGILLGHNIDLFSFFFFKRIKNIN